MRRAGLTRNVSAGSRNVRKARTTRGKTIPPILLIGAGHMGRALLEGWLNADLGPVVAVDPMPSPALRALAKTRALTICREIEAVFDQPARAAVVAVKPQILKTLAPLLRPIADKGVPMVSIAAGFNMGAMTRAWGARASIVRAMPNTPGAIGQGITALYAPTRTPPAARKLAETLLGALGQTIWVKREAQVDAATAVSGSGPAYVFLLVEALTAAGVAQGIPARDAARFARQTVVGAGALLAASKSDASELRRNVTSPGGTTEAALSILMDKDGLARLMARAVAAATARARELSA